MKKKKFKNKRTIKERIVEETILEVKVKQYKNHGRKKALKSLNTGQAKQLNLECACKGSRKVVCI